MSEAMFREELTYLLFPYVRRVSLLQSLVTAMWCNLQYIPVPFWVFCLLWSGVIMAYCERLSWWGLRRPVRLDTYRLVRYSFILHSDKSELGLRWSRLMMCSFFRNKSPTLRTIYVLSPRTKFEVNFNLNTAVNMFVNKPLYISYFICFFIFLWTPRILLGRCRSNSVGIMITLWARRFGFAFLAGLKDFCLLQNVQIDTGAHPASYSMGTGRSFLGDKATEA